MRDRDYPERTYQLDIMGRILNGTIYDHLPNGFHEEKNGAGEYIPLRNRRPCVHSNLCKIVVDDSVSLLFSEGHFPEIECGDKDTRDQLLRLVKETKLNGVMIDAATRGSIGSVAILFKVLKSRVFFEVFDTMFLTPVWDPEAPDTLLKVIETYKCKGQCFIDCGIKVTDPDAIYWYRREWTRTEEVHFYPQDLTARREGKEPIKDTTRTVVHNLGFTPMLWVKNLPGKASDTDGNCTFTAAIETQIEIDYQLSQAGRGLKYSSDPTLLIKEPAYGQDGPVHQGGSANALVVSTDGDAKLLEINGTAAQAVMEYVRCLREMGLESIHGNRVNADKISAAQSGRAMEMMNQALIWLADKLRTPYGEGALLDLLKMVIKANQLMDLLIDGEIVAKKALSVSEKVSLRWPAWYSPTASDLVSTANALATLIEAGALSRETAIKSIASIFDIEDIAAEKALIDAEQELAHKKAMELKENKKGLEPKPRAKNEPTEE
jgi:hypothetical protein